MQINEEKRKIARFKFQQQERENSWTYTENTEHTELMNTASNVGERAGTRNCFYFKLGLTEVVEKYKIK